MCERGGAVDVLTGGMTRKMIILKVIMMMVIIRSTIRRRKTMMNMIRRRMRMTMIVRMLHLVYRQRSPWLWDDWLFSLSPTGVR